MAQQAKNDLEPLLKAVVKLTRSIAARQKAIETLLIGKGVMTEQEWKAALKGSQPPTGPNQSDIKDAAKVAAYLETLTKH